MVKKISFVVACAFILYQGCVTLPKLLEERLPDEFSPQKLAVNLKGDFVNTPLPDLSSLAGQSFHYLGHGGQAVAFRSEDGNYVLKFFTVKALHGPKKWPIPKPTHWIPSHREKRAKAREAKRERGLMKAMKNYSLAYEKMPEKTGILAMHFVPSQEDLPTVQLIDMHGKVHTVDLTSTSFVLQKKAKLVKEHLGTLDPSQKKEAIEALAKLFTERAKLGCTDIESSFMIEANYGFIDDEPIQLDVGNIEFLDQIRADPEPEIERMHSLLYTWAKHQ
jgi:hypothetical protein